MGWGFSGKCAACHHEWEGISTSAHVGPWIPGTDASKVRELFDGWFCPRCALSLSISRSIDRNSWRKWLETDEVRELRRYPYLAGLVDNLDQAIGLGRLYVPIVVEFHPGDCPHCHEPFEKSVEEPQRLVCPQCRNSDVVLEGDHNHYCMEFSHHGFS